MGIRSPHELFLVLITTINRNLLNRQAKHAFNTGVHAYGGVLNALKDRMKAYCHIVQTAKQDNE